MVMAIQTQSEPKIMALRARGTWTGGMQTQVQVRTFEPLVLDEPAALGGADEGPNPMEYVLSALIGCASVMLAVVAQEQNFTYAGAQFDVRGVLDVRGLEGVPGVSPYFSSIKGTAQVKTDGSQQALDQVAAAIEARCPVISMLKAAGVDVEMRWIAQTV